jgi:hypothetical protein
MSVPLSEIRAMGNAVFDALESSGAESLDPVDGLYWCVGSGEAWDLSCQPSLLTGDLSDDISDIRKDLSDYAEIADKIAWHTLDHFIGVLTALSYQYKLRHDLLEGEAL